MFVIMLSLKWILRSPSSFGGPPLISFRSSYHPSGGILRHKYENDKVVTTDVIDGYVGCVQNLQINGDEIDMINTAKRAMNIGNCNVPVCQHNPCKNGASCHR